MPINQDAVPLITGLESKIGDRCRELARQEFQNRLQQKADAKGRFPPQPQLV